MQSSEYKQAMEGKETVLNRSVVGKKLTSATGTSPENFHALDGCRCQLQKACVNIGYIRVSSSHQNEHRQVDALKGECQEVVIEKASAGKRRPKFEALLCGLKEGDTLVVWDLDRAFRSLSDAVLTAERLRSSG